MTKIQFESERCFGCGACWSIAPENFTCNDDGRTVMINNEVTKEAIEASEICPVSAILIEGNCECDSCNCDNCSCGEESTECTCKDECNCTEENNCGCINNCTCSNECNCTDDCDCGCKNE